MDFQIHFALCISPRLKAIALRYSYDNAPAKSGPDLMRTVSYARFA